MVSVKWLEVNLASLFPGHRSETQSYSLAFLHLPCARGFLPSLCPISDVVLCLKRTYSAGINCRLKGQRKVGRESEST